MRPQEHTKIVILADLGTIRAFRLSPPTDQLAPHKGPAGIEEITLPNDEWNTDRPLRLAAPGKRLEPPSNLELLCAKKKQTMKVPVMVDLGMVSTVP